MCNDNSAKRVCGHDLSWYAAQAKAKPRVHLCMATKAAVILTTYWARLTPANVEQQLDNELVWRRFLDAGRLSHPGINKHAYRPVYQTLRSTIKTIVRRTFAAAGIIVLRDNAWAYTAVAADCFRSAEHVVAWYQATLDAAARASQARAPVQMDDIADQLARFAMCDDDIAPAAAPPPATGPTPVSVASMALSSGRTNGAGCNPLSAGLSNNHPMPPPNPLPTPDVSLAFINQDLARPPPKVSHAKQEVYPSLGADPTTDSDRAEHQTLIMDGGWRTLDAGREMQAACPRPIEAQAQAQAQASPATDGSAEAVPVQGLLLELVDKAIRSTTVSTTRERCREYSEMLHLVMQLAGQLEHEHRMMLLIMELGSREE
ncbi:hypothetical protein CH63R_03515 [Colletotrichum higginsianum IMI 349063]|uniref:Uncharacterized protein n=2 Tax=Colletotrichum higginsianum TaxID=80884 RepID=A0A1B7YRW6_COLHI|nr:hypothetical protein CH63R_03515 [Colletotrichum higginsianum IMI 349063]OBR14789.1 hypothetical protein CH63R_03515 [Colletotrichum higginsianum IMI 349063]TID01654.1 hypothetical protein CH35J_004871 [Colletotrichum higginsianum]GJD05209.1 hypothetical protein ColKHC_14034 [Colletotrichum higginsianum]